MSESLTIDLETTPTVMCDSTVERLIADGLILCRCQFPPWPGAWMSVRQTILVRPLAPVTVRWRAMEEPDETVVRLTRRSLHLISPGPAVRIDWHGGDRALAVGLAPAFLESSIAPMFDGRLPRLTPQAAIRDPVLTDMMSLFADTMSRGLKGASRSVGQFAVGFALRLHEVHGAKGGETRYVTGGLGASRQKRIATFIEANLDRAIPLAEMAAVVGLGPSHFGTAFRASFRRTPYQYLHERRVEKAKILLLEPDRSIVDIALDVGYSSHGHFTSVFRKVTGTTPSQFRMDRI